MRTNMFRIIMSGLIVPLLFLPGCSGLSTPSTTQAQLKATCSVMAGTTIGDVTVTTTTWFDETATAPAFCKVNGTRAPYLDIEVDVPEGWSGRLWQVGGGGLDGKITSAIRKDSSGAPDLDISLKTGRSIYVASNGGNRSLVPEQAAPLVWTDGTLAGIISANDYAYEALNTTREFAKAVTKSFYGKLPDHTYFAGCSNGGRNAYMAAERWPQEYDGIVTGCMGMDLVGQTSEWMNFGARTGTPAMPSPVQWSAVSLAAVTACDALDGITDGIIANQSACTFDASTLQCGLPGADVNCLTAAQVLTVKELTSDLKLADGTTVFSGYNWADWGSSVDGFGRLGSAYAMLATGDSAWLGLSKQQTFDLNRDYLPFQFGLYMIGAAPDKSKVAAFVASGRKLISWHAGSDNLTSPNDHIRNHTTMTNIAKGMGLTNPSNNTRFFIVPGASHGLGAPLTEVNWFDAITRWVETNSAPEQLTYNFIDAKTKAERTLPVCQPPLYPKYKGAGDVNSAGSYTCANP